MNDVKETQPNTNSVSKAEEDVSVSLVFRNVPKEKRVALEKLAKEFTRKHRKLMNYIEK
ncbi:hypothetical protein ACTBT5_003142 [Yersinia enterocolitica]